MKTSAKYDEEELEILQAWEAGRLKPVTAKPCVSLMLELDEGLAGRLDVIA